MQEVIHAHIIRSIVIIIGNMERFETMGESLMIDGVKIVGCFEIGFSSGVLLQFNN